MRAAVAVLVAVAAAGAPTSAGAQWSFVATPTDQLAVPGLAAASEITPEGDIYTGFGELVFGFGDPLVAWVQPQRRLAAGGRYPIFASSRDRAGVRYTVSLVAAGVDGVAVDLVRVRMRNLGPRARRAGWSVGVRRSGGGAGLNALGAPAFRYLAPAASQPGLYTQAGDTGVPRWAVAGGAIVRTPAAGGPAAAFALLAPGGTGSVAAGCVRRTQICARVTYAPVLGPGRTATLEFELPAVPLRVDGPAVGDTRRVGYAGAVATVRRSFDAVLGRGMRLTLPERGVQDAYYAGLVQILTSRYQLAGPAGAWVQAVNDLQYHAFWLRDAAIMTNALDLAGLALPAREDLDYFASWQRPDGLFISRPEQYDGVGQALWALGRHAELTRDAAWAAAVLPSVGRAVDWVGGQLAGDGGLLPSGNPGDDEYVAGRLAGDNFWAVAGVDAAVRLALVARRTDLATAWGAVATRLRRRVAAATRAAAARDRGAVPPALDRAGGRDWGNWWVAYPDGPLAPDDPIVGATIRRARAGFREGIATYAGQLHDYTGFRIFETELLRGDQTAVVGGLYAELAHATGTLGGFETDIRPGGNRSSAANLTPHGTYSGELVALIRNMLVRDDAGRVLLLGAVPPAWLLPGKVVSVARAPTAHGLVSFVLRTRPGGAVLSWAAPAGTALAWPVPVGVSRFRASRGRVARGVLALPGASGSVAVGWRLRARAGAGAPARAPTLASTIAALRRAYRRS